MKTNFTITAPHFIKKCAGLLILSLLGISTVFGANNTKGAYYTGEYRNLFAEAGYTKEQIHDKLNKVFETYYYGDSAQRLYFTAGKNENGPLAYFVDVWNNDVRSEGMSYGMMIALQMDKKAEFDALWNWAVTFMYVTKEGHPSKGYFSWSVARNGVANAETAAPDGEEYFAMALYFAAHRWGNGEGLYNYKAWADKILTDVRHRAIIKGTAKNREITVGPMVNEFHKMILFVPDSGANHFTDPSYHLPAFYELWALWGPEPDRSFWAAAADSSREYFVKAQHPVTGLSTDYANFDGTPAAIKWNPFSGHFSYDSWRTAANWSVDWMWWQKDPRQQELSNRIQSFFASFGIDKYGSQFEKSGKVLNPEHRTGLVATNAVVSLAASHAIAPEFVKALWNAPMPLGHGDRYYDGCLYMMCLLHCSGNFKIWKPGL